LPDIARSIWRFHPFSDQGCPPENHYL